MSLHVSVVTETYPPEINGVAMTVGRLTAGLRNLGHRVDLVRPRQHGEDVGNEEEMTVKGIAMPGYPGLRLGLPARRILEACWKKERPQVVHVVTEGPLGWSAVSAARRLGIPVSSGFHTNFDSYSAHYGAGWLRPAVSSYLTGFHRRTQATLVPTQALAASLASLGVPGVRLVGRGVDTDLFHPVRRSADLRRHWQAGERTLVCLYVGRLAPEKNLSLAEQAFAAIQAEHSDARMVWVGDGPARQALQEKYPLHHFAGARTGEDLAAHYASADLFLFPSLTETYGNVVAEAMASGLAVIAYRSAAAAELIRDGENGVTVAPGDAQAFLRAATRLAAPRDDSGLGKQARLTTLAHGWPSVVRSFAEVLQSVRDGRP